MTIIIKSLSDDLGLIEDQIDSYSATPTTPAFSTFSNFVEDINTDYTIVKSTTTSVGDLIVVSMVSDIGSGLQSAPLGWTLLGTTTLASQVTSSTWYKIATASEPTSYTFSTASMGTSALTLVEYTNVDRFDPINTFSSVPFDSTFSQDITTVTTVTDYSIVVNELFINNTTSDINFSDVYIPITQYSNQYQIIQNYSIVPSYGSRSSGTATSATAFPGIINSYVIQPYRVYSNQLSTTNEFTPTDTVSYTVGLVTQPTLVNTLTITDSVGLRRTITNPNITDTLVVSQSDTFRWLPIQKTYSFLTLTDSVIIKNFYNISSSITVTDAVVVVLKPVQRLVDTLVITDLVTSPHKYIVDTLNITDSVTTNQIMQSLTDQLRITHTGSATKLRLDLTDTLNVTDAVRTNPAYLAPSHTLVISDQVSINQPHYASCESDLTITEVIVGDYITIHNQSIVDYVSLSEELKRPIVELVSHTLTITDNLTTSSRIVNQDLNITDSMSYEKLTVVTETLVITHSVSRVIKSKITLVDNLSLSSSIFDLLTVDC